MMIFNDSQYFEFIQFAEDVYNYLKPIINPYYETELIITDQICKEGSHILGGSLYHNKVIIYLNDIIHYIIKLKGVDIDEYCRLIKIHIIQTITHELYHTIQNMNYYLYTCDIDYNKVIEDTCYKKEYEFLSNLDIQYNICNRYYLSTSLFQLCLDTFVKNDTNHKFISILENTDEYFFSLLYSIMDTCDAYLDFSDRTKSKNKNFDMFKYIKHIMDKDDIYIEFNNIKYTIKQNGIFNNNFETINDLNKLDSQFALLYYSNYNVNVYDMCIDIQNDKNIFKAIIKCDYKLLPIKREIINRVLT